MFHYFVGQGRSTGVLPRKWKPRYRDCTIVGWHWASRFVTALQEVNLITLIEMPLTSLQRE